ncbi:hypothetical protein ACFLU6_08870, partial [Acidobacteriota bacterium]
MEIDASFEKKTKSNGQARAIRIILPLIVVMVSLGIYLNSIRNQFVLDDLGIVVDNLYVTQPGHLKDIFRSNYWAPAEKSNLYRPLTVLSLALNHQAGGLDPRGFHVVNMLLHAGASILLYFILLQLLKGKEEAFAVALLFAAHPIHVEAVTPVVGRSEGLSGVLIFAALLCYLRARDNRVWILAPLSGLFFLAATWSKESSFALPALILICEWFYPGRKGFKRFLRVIPYVLLAALSFFFRIWILGEANMKTPVAFIDNPLVRHGIVTRIYTAGEITFDYIRLMVFPRVLSADYSYAQVEPVQSPLQAIFAIKVLVLLLIMTAALLLRKKIPEFLFAALFFLAAYAPVANVIVPTGTIMAERLMYVPSAAFCMIAGALLARLYGMASSRAKITAAVITVLMVGGYSVRTVFRNRDFKDNGTLFSKTVQTSPKSEARAGLIRLQQLFRTQG